MRFSPREKNPLLWALTLTGTVCVHDGHVGCTYGLQKGASSKETPIPPPSTCPHHTYRGTETQKHSRGHEGHVNYILWWTLWEHLIYPNPWQLFNQALSVTRGHSWHPSDMQETHFTGFPWKIQLFSAAFYHCQWHLNRGPRRQDMLKASPQVSLDSFHCRACNASIQRTGVLEFLKSFGGWVVSKLMDF